MRANLHTLPLGGTAIGTGFGAPGNYRDHLYPRLCRLTGIEFTAAADAFDAMQNLDTFVRVSGELRATATSLGKIASDLILVSSGPNGGLGEIILPAVQAGSSIMSGKVNPVVSMSMVQLAFAVVGNEVTVQPRDRSCLFQSPVQGPSVREIVGHQAGEQRKPHSGKPALTRPALN